MHPLFLVVVLLGFFFDGVAVLWSILAVLFHETGHVLMAKSRGYVVDSLVLMPYGAEMSSEDNIDSNSSVAIGLAGPLVNLFLALAVLGVWWIFPSVYPFTKPFLQANLTLAFFNLLPAYPLDGARVLVGLSKHKLKAVKALKISGIVLSAVALGLFVASCFFGVNFTLLTTAIFLFYGGVTSQKDPCYVGVFSPVSKDYTLGVEKKHVIVSKHMPIYRLLRFSGQNNLITFEIEGTDFTFDESVLKDVALKHKLSTEIGDVF